MINSLLAWIHANQGAAFIGGIFLIIVLGMLLDFMHRALMVLAHGSCGSCHDKHEDDREEEHTFS